MPTRYKNISQNQYYHLYNRGVNKQQIFFSEDNYTYCLHLVKKNAERHQIKIIAYCLMPNHYHFLVRPEDEHSISRFIQSTFNSYVQALNKQLDRKGPLFEGRFKHVLVDKDEDLMHLIRYIHRNPVEAGLVESPDKWIFSNYLEFIEERKGSLVDLSVRDMYFSSAIEYKFFVEDLDLVTPGNLDIFTID
ncbi:transposase [candidate division KSB1 bacterium]|nr:transposase [candidate division KSB1 bacterium]